MNFFLIYILERKGEGGWEMMQTVKTLRDRNQVIKTSLMTINALKSLLVWAIYELSGVYSLTYVAL